MRIAYVCADPGVPIFGPKGCSVHVQEVLNALRELGHSVEVFAANSGNPPSSVDLPIHCLPVKPDMPRAHRERNLYNLNKTIPDLLKTTGPFDLFYERHSLWSYAVMEHARSVGSCSILEVNAPLIREQQKYRKLIHLELAQKVATRAFRSAGSIVVVSNEIVPYVKRFTNGKCISVVPNGVNPKRFPKNTSATVARKKGVFTIGFVGSLKPWHGLSAIAEAFAFVYARHPGVRLLIVGDGPERQKLEETLRKRKLLGAALFTGAVLPENIPGLLFSMDVGVAPYSKDAEHYFSPLKLYEYMAAGLPVIAGRIGQIPEVIKDEKTGLLITPGSGIELGKAIERLLNDQALRERLGKAARMNAFYDHTWKGRVLRILDSINGSTAVQPETPSLVNEVRL